MPGTARLAWGFWFVPEGDGTRVVTETRIDCVDDAARRAMRAYWCLIRSPSGLIRREILRLLLPLRHVVVATGGGTFMDAENRAAINLDGVSVWLDVPFDVVVSRLPADGRRPLAADRTQMERLFAARQASYAQAHVRIEPGQ